MAYVGEDNNQSGIELYIEELVLHGFPRRDRLQISDSVGHELMRLLGEQGVPSGLERQSGQVNLQGSEITVSPGLGAESVGTEIARSVYGSFTSTGTGRNK
jgi:hypothetical protein